MRKEGEKRELRLKIDKKNILFELILVAFNLTICSKLVVEVTKRACLATIYFFLPADLPPVS